MPDQLVLQREQQRQVAARADREMQLRVARRFGFAGIDDEQSRGLAAQQTVAHPLPQHRLGLGDVVAP